MDLTPCVTVGSGKGLDCLGKESSLPRNSPSTPVTAPEGDEDDQSSSECPELSVEEMTSITMTTDTSSSAHPLPSTGNGSSQSRSLEITTANSSLNITGTSNNCKSHCASVSVTYKLHSIW